MQELPKRIITGIIFGAVFLGSIFWNEYSFLGLFLIFTLIGLREFYQIAELEGGTPQKMQGIVISIFLFYSFWAIGKGISHPGMLILFMPLLFSVFIVELYRNKEKAVGNIAYTFLGVIYVGLSFSMLNFLMFHNGTNEYSWHLLLGFILLIWANDVGAYFTGRKFGKNRLFERVSPKKSWEGAIGGGVFSILVAYGISMKLPDLHVYQWMIVSVIVSFTGIWGDLVESLFKRSVALKDSGNILPGHGGILDRFDSLLLSTPFVVAYIQYFV